MKIHIVVLLLFTVVATVASAQINNSLHQGLRRPGMVPIPPVPANGTEKTTATLWRVAATSAYVFDNSTLEITDSSLYRYSDGRGSSFNYAGLFLDDVGVYTDVMYDTAIKFHNLGNGLEKLSKYINDYDANNNGREAIQLHFDGGRFNNDNKTVVVRDIADKVTHYISFNWNDTTSTWDSSFISVFGYDSQDNLITENSYSLAGGVQVPVYVVNFKYDSSGLLSEFEYSYWNGSTWTDKARVLFTYQSNLIVTAKGQLFTDSMWVNNFLDSVGYDANGVYNFYEGSEWDSAMAKWVSAEREIRIIDSLGRPSLVSYSNWDTAGSIWESYSEIELFYNANSNVNRINSYEFTGGVRNIFPTHIKNYYYEYYFNVGVTGAEEAEPVTVYPNPATDILYILVTGAKDTRITLINTAGQVVRSFEVKDNVRRSSINIHGLPAGNYILNVVSADALQGRQLVTIR